MYIKFLICHFTFVTFLKACEFACKQLICRHSQPQLLHGQIMNSRAACSYYLLMYYENEVDLANKHKNFENEMCHYCASNVPCCKDVRYDDITDTVDKNIFRYVCNCFSNDKTLLPCDVMLWQLIKNFLYQLSADQLQQ